MFYSHPKDSEGNEHPLEDHLKRVAEKARELLTDTKFDGGTGYYAGLFHDLGKLNPYYQNLFAPNGPQIAGKFVRKHSIFSAWAAKKLLPKQMSKKARNAVVFAIAGHHTSLSQRLAGEEESLGFKSSKERMLDNLKSFQKQVILGQEFSSLDWKTCLEQFAEPISFQERLASDPQESEWGFLEANATYSALLQADRGSFKPWEKPAFKIPLETGCLMKAGSKLSAIRTGFQSEVLSRAGNAENLMLLQAPTGIGKTKLFLDLARIYSQKQSFERIFYFSPLLALTEDFEGKLMDVVPKGYLKQVLEYNHVFAGSLEDKEDGNSFKQSWSFELESFNYPLIVTTTQRLLMTLYSNSASDKMKFLSLKNSLLIIDEVQTLPKFLLPNLVKLLKSASESMGCKVLFVSATVPEELKTPDIYKIPFPETIADAYLELTLKNIKFAPNFEVASEPLLENPPGKVMIMANTRKKASDIFDKVSSSNPDALYLSSGIRKKTRSGMLERIKKAPSALVVCTQVLEAGVDVSFSQILRETAPIDSILQAMGRLNRECENEEPTITIFDTNGRNTPYSELEYAESVKALNGIENSKELYKILGSYYSTVSQKNEKNRRLSQQLDTYFGRLDFDEIWKFVWKNALPEETGDTVFIPESEAEWEDFKKTFASPSGPGKGAFKKFAGLTASFPGQPSRLGISDMFDEDLLEKGILLPKKDKLTEVYDEKVGLDKWLKRK